jgi:hypothetical protein
VLDRYTTYGVLPSAFVKALDFSASDRGYRLADQWQVVPDTKALTEKMVDANPRRFLFTT